MEFDTILYEVEERTAVITFNRPDQLNAISPHMAFELRRAYAAAEADEEVWTLLITANGRAFCSRRRRHRDPRRRPGHLRGAVPLDLSAVGGAAGGHAAVPHHDEADHHRGERLVLRRRARPRHLRRHRDRLGAGGVLRPAREHRAGVGPRDGAAGPGAADRHRHAGGPDRPSRAHERAAGLRARDDLRGGGARPPARAGEGGGGARQPERAAWPSAAPDWPSARASTSPCTRPRSWPRPSGSASSAPTTPRRARWPSGRSGTRSGVGRERAAGGRSVRRSRRSATRPRPITSPPSRSTGPRCSTPSTGRCAMRCATPGTWSRTTRPCMRSCCEPRAIAPFAPASIRRSPTASPTTSGTTRIPASC